MKRTPLATIIVCAPLAFALATPQLSAAETSVFTPDYFAVFASQTAAEMVENLPGFVLINPEQGRGLSQGGTNVLLNGRPITGKGESPAAQLAQVAARNVVRIELVDATQLNMPGYEGVVANIITQRSDFTGSWAWAPEWRAHNEANLGNGSINVSGALGNWGYTAALDGLMVRASFIGPESVSAADGTVFERRNEVFRVNGEQPTLSGSLNWQNTSGHAFNSKASIDRLNVVRPQISKTFALLPRGQDSLNQSLQAQDQTNLQFDVDYARPAFGGELKLIGLAEAQENALKSEVQVYSSQGDLLTNRRFTEVADQAESILRFEQNWSTEAGHNWQLAGESVVNKLDITTQLTGYTSLNPADITFQTRTADRIEETRGELTLAHSRKIGRSLDFQSSVGAEISQISDGSIEREFLRPKGFVALSHRRGPQLTLSARLDREVGQINFRDFAASVSLVEETETRRNGDLVPPQLWALSGRMERRFQDGHSVAFDARFEQITDLIDRIPIGTDGEGIGNIEKAEKTKIGALVTLVGDPIGFKGTRLDLQANWQWSSLEDPVQGFDRDISGLRRADIKAEFRHDIPNTDLSYGVTLQHLDFAPRYSPSFIQTADMPSGGLSPGENAIFVEAKNLNGLRARLTISEFLEQEAGFARTIYTGRRDTSLVDRVEVRRRDLDGPFLQISVAGTF